MYQPDCAPGPVSRSSCTMQLPTPPGRSEDNGVSPPNAGGRGTMIAFAVASEMKPLMMPLISEVAGLPTYVAPTCTSSSGRVNNPSWKVIVVETLPAHG